MITNSYSSYLLWHQGLLCGVLDLLDVGECRYYMRDSIVKETNKKFCFLHTETNNLKDENLQEFRIQTPKRIGDMVADSLTKLVFYELCLVEETKIRMPKRVGAMNMYYYFPPLLA